MKKICFLFSGGGAQYPGMMKELYDNIPACKEIFDKADDAVGKKLSEVIFAGTKEELSETSTMIPAIFTADIAAFAALRERGVTASAVAGFSLGEWAAVTAAGVIPFEQAMEIVQFRSDAMSAATPKEGAGMAVIMGKPNEYVEELCARVKDSYVCPANYNYPGQITVSGTDAGLHELERLANEDGAIYKHLAVNVPSHCALMEPAMRALGQKLENVAFQTPLFPIVSNCTAKATSDPAEIKRNIITQLVSPVRFEQSIRNLHADGVDTFVELGPGKTLFTFVKKIAKKAEIELYAAHVEDLSTLEEALELVK